MNCVVCRSRFSVLKSAMKGYDCYCGPIACMTTEEDVKCQFCKKEPSQTDCPACKKWVCVFCAQTHDCKGPPRTFLVLSLLAALTFLPACPMAGLAVIPYVIDPQAEVEFQKRKEKELHEALDYCRYDAVDNDTDEVLCVAGDCECHEALVRHTFEQYRKTHGYPL